MINETIPAAYLILIQNEKILLLRRANTGYEDGNYSVVAGHVEPGENFTQCIIRESWEEAGIVIKQDDLKVVHVMHRDSQQKSKNQRIEVFFSAKKWTGEIRNMEKDKCDDLSWFDLNNLPENMIPYIEKAIGYINDSVIYSDYGWDE